MRTSIAICLLASLGMGGCNSSNDGKSVDINFAESDRNFTPIFSDYNVSTPDQNNEEFYQLSGTHETLPEPFESNKGWLLNGMNRSDDLFMSVKGYVNGFEADKQYDLTISVDFITNVSSDCVGIGGAPGESVYFKLGASTTEPKNVISDEIEDGIYRLNIDKGNQISSGSNALNVGHIANGIDCEEPAAYQKKSLKTEQTLEVKTDEDGGFWVIAGTDSGFEGLTHYYIERLSVEAE